MLIVCPDCETSYEVDPADLGARGRKVRCSECSAVWHEAADGALAEPEADLADLSADDADELAEDEEFDTVALRAADEIEDVAVEKVAPVARAPRRKGRGTAPRALARPRFMPIMAAAGLAALAAAGIWREAVVRVAPDLAGLYAAAGLPVNLRGLEFRDMNTVETMENGVPLLLVRGTIANVTARDADVPRLRLSVRGVSGREIFVWTAMPGRNELKAGEAVAFTAQLASPPAEGREVAVRFLGAHDAAKHPVTQ